MAMYLVARRSYNSPIKIRTMRLWPSLDKAVQHAFDETGRISLYTWAFYEFQGYGQPPKRLTEKMLKANATYVLLTEL